MSLHRAAYIVVAVTALLAPAFLGCAQREQPHEKKPAKGVVQTANPAREDAPSRNETGELGKPRTADSDAAAAEDAPRNHCEISGGDPRFAQRWTKQLKLGSLAQIDEVLDTPLGKRGKFRELLLHNADGNEISVVTGRDYANGVAAGYESDGTMYDEAMESWCHTLVVPLLYLKMSKPSCVSYLSPFNFSRDWRALLPISVGHPLLASQFVRPDAVPRTAERIEPSDWHDDREFTAADFERLIEQGSRLGDLFAHRKLRVMTNLGPNRVTLISDWLESDYVVSAWGDFNCDGLEDALLAASHFVTDGNERWHRLYVVTRHGPEEAFEVLEEWASAKSTILTPANLRRALAFVDERLPCGPGIGTIR